MQILNTEEEHPPFHLRIAEYDVDERGEPSTEPWRDPSGEALRDRLRDPSKKSGGEERRSLGRRSVEKRNLGRRSVGGEDRRTVGRRSKRGDSSVEKKKRRENQITTLTQIDYPLPGFIAQSHQTTYHLTTTTKTS
ncbi:hypothetical protein Bca4012_095933 [Brassica carinata]|uniref:Uncharacterized protein n=2 Tax=Brassica TaxID=3705 RepID=A0ABQ7YCW9_BRANA|nr:hypothetical protein Bca52824_078212 [Brassica carinata]KAH0865574.1 hypothetical protein HID58_082785 [Brassica napus]